MDNFNFLLKRPRECATKQWTTGNGHAAHHDHIHSSQRDAVRVGRNRAATAMKRLTLILLCGCLAACNQTTAQMMPRPDTSKISDQSAFAEAKTAVLGKLKDPNSAKFGPFRRKIFINADGQYIDLVCGAVNSKNSFGAYAGATWFVHGVGYSDSATFETDQYTGFIVNEECTG